MESSKKFSIDGLIFAISAAILSLLMMILLFDSRDWWTFIYFTFFGGFTVLCIGGFMRKRNILMVIGIGIVALAELVRFIFLLDNYGFNEYWSGFYFFGFFPVFVRTTLRLGVVFVVVCFVFNVVPQIQQFIRKLWFLPAAIELGCWVLGLTIYLFDGDFYAQSLLVTSFAAILEANMFAIMLMFGMRWLGGMGDLFRPAAPAAAPYGAPAYNGYNAPAYNGYNAPAYNGYNAPAYNGYNAPAYNPAPAPAYNPAPAPSAPVSDALSQELMQYKEMLDGGLITPDEFEAKKRELMGI